MAATRTIIIKEDSQGRKLPVEVSDDIDILVASEESDEVFETVSVKDKVKQVSQSLPELISNTASAVFDGVRGMLEPTKVSLEFGVDVGAEGGIWFIAKGTVNSSIKISIEWNNEKEKAAAPQAGEAGASLPSQKAQS